jgi:hypothetical protein
VPYGEIEVISQWQRVTSMPNTSIAFAAAEPTIWLA